MEQTMTDRNGNTINFNDPVILDTFDRGHPGLFKGMINDTLAYFKPEWRYDISGYGTTITVFRRNIIKPTENDKETQY